MSLDAGSPQTLPLPSQCSEACGGGEQQRLVTCPEPGLCEEALRPNSTRSCNTHPCTQWVVGPWGQVSKCGGLGQGEGLWTDRRPCISRCPSDLFHVKSC